MKIMIVVNFSNQGGVAYKPYWDNEEELFNYVVGLLKDGISFTIGLENVVATSNTFTVLEGTPDGFVVINEK